MFIVNPSSIYVQRVCVQGHAEIQSRDHHVSTSQSGVSAIISFFHVIYYLGANLDIVGLINFIAVPESRGM